MNNLSGTLKYGSVAVVALFLVACACLSGIKNPGITCGQDSYGAEYILITSKAGLPGQTWTEINQSLGNYNNHLYIVRRYKNGKVKEEKGALALKKIQKGWSSDLLQGEKDYTGYVGVFGDSCTWQSLLPQREALLRQLKGTLKKYNK
jgi:hypothetical protein